MRFWSFPKQGKRRRNQLRIEQLEDRYCPSVSVAAIPLSPGQPAAGYQLLILGDSGVDTVNILDQGNQHVSVTDGAGNLLGSFTGVRTTLFEGGTGTDAVNYTLTAPLVTGELIYIDLGSGGNDQAKVDLSQGVIGASVFVCVVGNNGDDNISASIGAMGHAHAAFFLNGGGGNDLVQFGTATDIDARSTLSVTASGGTGDDQTYIAFSGLVFGTLNVQANAGSGNDTVNVNVKVEEDSTGRVYANATGGTGNDDITLYMNDYSGDLIRSTLSVLRGRSSTTPVRRRSIPRRRM